MDNKKNANQEEDQGALSTRTHGGFFEIHVRGHLDESWSDWLEGLEVKLLDNGEMILFGYIEDQAALMGILNKLYGLNLTLLSLREVGRGHAAQAFCCWQDTNGTFDPNKCSKI